MAGKRFTARFVESVSTTLDRQEYRDAAVRGLELRVTRVGAKTWAFRYRRKSDGKQRRVTLGSYPAFSLEEARQLVKVHAAAVGRGADPAADVQERRVASKFAEIAEEWLERHGRQNKSARALRDDRSMLDRHILPVIGSMKAAEIEKRDLIRLFDCVAGKADARLKVVKDARTLTHRPNRVFELVRSIFRWAVGRDLLKVDPSWGLVPPIKKERPRDRELSPDEICQLWAALERAPRKRRATRGLARGERALADDDIPITRSTALAMQLSLVTAQRIGEVTGIAIPELKLSDATPVWIVPAARSKNGHANRVPLSPLAIRLIQEAQGLAGDSHWLFPSPTRPGPIDPHAPTKALARARAAIGIDDFRIHDLRRTAATQMAELGTAPHTISLVLNHVSARRGTITSKVYVQYSYDREKREALAAWSERLECINAISHTSHSQVSSEES